MVEFNIEGRAIEVKSWNQVKQHFLREQQLIYLAAEYNNLQEVVSNGRKTDLFVAYHQDDEVIGTAGRMKLSSEGVRYRPNRSLDTLLEAEPKSYRMGGLKLYSEKEIMELKERLAKGKLYLDLLPEEPHNVIVVYIANGAKTEETVIKDVLNGYPTKSIEQVLKDFKFGNKEVEDIHQLTRILNSLRYAEALSSLSHVGASGAIFLQHSSSEIRKDTGNAAYDLATIIKMLKPETVCTLSPFEVTHDAHEYAAHLTANAICAVQSDGYKPYFRGYPVWNPIPLFHPHIVDISEVIDDKLDAIHIHSLFGSQGNYARRYETTVGLNRIVAAALIHGINIFHASMQRPRLPSGVLAIEQFVDLAPLLDYPDMTIRDFSGEQVKQIVEKIPNVPRVIPKLL